MSKLLEAGEVVDRYAQAFYRTVRPDLAEVHGERVQALAAGVTPHTASLLYEVNFTDIEDVVHGWLATCALNLTHVASMARALPGIIDREARSTNFAADFDRNAVAVGHLMFNGNAGLAGIALNEGEVPLEFIYTLLALFNNSHALTAREKMVVPASLAMFVQDCAPKVDESGFFLERKDPLAIFRANGLPVLAEGVHASEVYYAAEGQAGPQIWYPAKLWANIA